MAGRLSPRYRLVNNLLKIAIFVPIPVLIGVCEYAERKAPNHSPMYSCQTIEDGSTIRSLRISPFGWYNIRITEDEQVKAWFQKRFEKRC